MTAKKKNRFSKRLEAVTESATLKLNSMVQQMKSEGVPVINLTAGEPDFNVPEAAKTAVIQAVNQNKSKYTPVPGIPELRELIAAKTNSQQPRISQAWKASDVIVSNGGKQALFNVLMSILNPGDEVIIISPYWLSYPDMVKIAGGKPKIIRTSFDSGFKVLPKQLKKAITAKTKAVIFNSPSNPTGVMYSREEFAELGKVILTASKKRQIWAISDEIYDTISFGNAPFCSFLDATPALQDQCVTINGLSKSGAMTGWRLGWAVGPADLIQTMIKLQGQSTSGISALTQAAGVGALRLDQSEFISQAQTFRRRSDLALEILQKSGKIKVVAPQGAFYVFVGIEKCLRKGMKDSVQFAERLLQEAKVAVVPGNSFGESMFIRLSFATDERSLQEGCGRIVSFIGEKKK